MFYHGFVVVTQRREGAPELVVYCGQESETLTQSDVILHSVKLLKEHLTIILSSFSITFGKI